MVRTACIALCAALFVAGCGATTTGGGRAVVNVSESDEFLKLRAGPGLGFRVILGLPDGTEVNRGACTTEMGQEWCRVSLVRAPGVSGHVAADYLVDR